MLFAMEKYTFYIDRSTVWVALQWLGAFYFFLGICFLNNLRSIHRDITISNRITMKQETINVNILYYSFAWHFFSLLSSICLQFTICFTLFLFEWTTTWTTEKKLSIESTVIVHCYYRFIGRLSLSAHCVHIAGKTCEMRRRIKINALASAHSHALNKSS